MTPVLNYLIKRPIIKSCILIAVFIVCLSSLSSVKRYALPRVDLLEVTITTVAPGFSASEVELQVTKPIEDELETVSGIKKFTSTSSQNMSFIYVFIKPETSDVEGVKRDLRNAVKRVNDLPKGAKTPVISEIKVDNKPMMTLGVVSESGDMENVRYHTLKLRRELKRLQGISKVIKRNVLDKEIQILLNKRKMKKYSISSQEVIDAIKLSKKRLFSGNISSNKFNKSIIVYSDFDNPERIKSIIIRATGLNERDGIAIKVGDVAEVKWGLEKEKRILKYNGKKGMGLELVKDPQSDILRTSKRALTFLEKHLKEANDKDIDIIVHLNDSEETATRLEILYENGAIGLLLVSLVLVFFLNLRIAFWTAFGIPFSILLSLLFMAIFDISVNNVSLSGMIVVWEFWLMTLLLWQKVFLFIKKKVIHLKKPL